MKTLAAVLVETGKPLVLTELEIPALKPGQALVKIVFSGVCHTQVLECRGYRGADPFLPHCLGHEGTGVVCETGQDVKKVKAGDKAILSWIQGSGANIGGTLYTWKDKNVNAGGITTFSHYSVISENRLTALPKDVSMRDAALVGCAIPTGVGAVCNTARPEPGQSIAIFGTGGVGLCAVAGAKIKNCHPVIAVDMNPDKLSLAEKMGATHKILADKNGDSAKAVQELCPSGLDFAIEASGRPHLMVQALHSVRHRGGTAVVIGNARYGERMELDPRQLNFGKRLLGTWGGDNEPDKHFLWYCELLRTQKLNIAPLITRTYSLQDINAAIDDLESGEVIRPLIDMEKI